MRYNEEAMDHLCGESLWINGWEYKQLKDFPDYYIAEDGEIVSTIGYGLTFMKTWPNQYGHRYVRLRDRFGNKKRVSIHRLVAETYIPNPNNYPVVRHLDDCPENNDYWNLAWGTQADNVHDCLERKRFFHKEIYCYELDRVFFSGAEAADYFNVNRSTITACCEGKIHSVRGMHLCYLEDKDYKLKNTDKYFGKSGNYKRVKATDLSNGDTYIFKSRMEAADFFGIPNCGISSVISGKIKHTHGIFFEDLEDDYDRDY